MKRNQTGLLMALSVAIVSIELMTWAAADDLPVSSPTTPAVSTSKAVTPATKTVPILFLSQYHSISQPDAVIYGIFNQNGKPSVKIPVATSGGNLNFTLRGIQNPKRFMVQAIFEDAQGNAVGDPPTINFIPPDKPDAPAWFAGLEHIVGMASSHDVQLPVPAGVSVVDLIGEPDSTVKGGGKLLGFVSDIQVPGATVQPPVDVPAVAPATSDSTHSP